jgi:electron transfer flavoprotein beta subunit
VPPRIVVIVSVGCNPVSGQRRRAVADPRAVELALGAAGSADALAVIHAGDPAEPALRDYLGMGIGRLVAIEQPAGADPAPALLGHLGRLGARLVLTGDRAEAGEASGFLPY